jgi:hypothetical protein
MKTFILAGVFTVATAFDGLAQDKDLTPAAMAEIAMSEQLFAIGKARGEPVMMLAAMRMRDTLGMDTAAPAATFTSKEDMLAAAREAAGGDTALLGVIEDVAASGSRRMCIYARNGVCY